SIASARSRGSARPAAISLPRSAALRPEMSVMRAPSLSPAATVAASRRMDNPGRRVFTAAMMDESDILIVGGGLNGPALALALAGAGLRVTVVDAQPAGQRGREGFDGRAYALALASVRLLTALGVWGRVADK